MTDKMMRKILNPWVNREGYDCFGCCPTNPYGVHMDFYEDEPYMIRRSRGYAPLPVMMGEETKGQVLAIGGELKNTFCIGRDDLFYPSPYVGDMEDVRTVQALRESVVRLEELLETKHEIVACDMHPKYNTTLAKDLASWNEIKTKLTTGSITRETYDHWRYHYPDFDDTRIHAAVPPEEPVKSKRGRKPKTKE